MSKYAVNTIGIKVLRSMSLTIKGGVSIIDDTLSRVQCILDSNQTAFGIYKDSLESIINDIQTILKDASESNNGILFQIINFRLNSVF